MNFTSSMNQSHSELLQAVVGATTATAAYIVGQIEQSVPGWVRDYGVPIVMLAGTVWALVAIAKELSRERLARIADRDRFIDMMRTDMAASNTAREALLRATIDQTNEFKSLRRTLIRNGNVPDHAEE